MPKNLNVGDLRMETATANTKASVKIVPDDEELLNLLRDYGKELVINAISYVEIVPAGIFRIFVSLSTPKVVRQAEKPAFPRNLFERVAEFEKQEIKKALESAGGDRYQASDLLGIPCSTMNQKIKRLGIEV